MQSKVIACGAGFAGDRVEPAVALAASGQVEAVALECLAERTIVPGLRARSADPDKGFDPRLDRRLRPLLPVAYANGCKVLSNICLLYTSPSPRDVEESRMPSSA